jgi:putative transposon-encoded protein
MEYVKIFFWENMGKNMGNLAFILIPAKFLAKRAYKNRFFCTK